MIHPLVRPRLIVPGAPNLWTKGRTLEAEIASPATRFEGHVVVEKVHARTGLVTQRLAFKNLITDAGLNALGSTARISTFDYLAVGTGSTAPAVGQTSLVGEIGRTNNKGGLGESNATQVSSTYYEYTYTRTFYESEANGNIAELGLFSASSGGTMWMRQLLRDSGGSATTITKTSEDQLRITYKLRCYWPTADVGSVVTISGVSYTFNSRAQSVNDVEAWGRRASDNVGILGSFGFSTAAGIYMEANESQTLGAVTANTFGGDTQSTTTLQTYGASSYYRDIEFIYQLDKANYTLGIGRFTGPVCTAFRTHQTSVTPRIAKDNTKRLTIYFRCSWGRTA